MKRSESPSHMMPAITWAQRSSTPSHSRRTEVMITKSSAAACSWPSVEGNGGGRSQGEERSGSLVSAQQVGGSGSSDGEFRGPVETRKVFQRVPQSRTQPGCRRHAALQMEEVDDQATGFAVKEGIHPADQTIAGQNWHRVVAVLALGGWDVDLPLVGEAEYVRNTLAPPQQVIQRRQETNRGIIVGFSSRDITMTAQPVDIFGEQEVRSARPFDLERDHGAGVDKPPHDRPTLLRWNVAPAKCAIAQIKDTEGAHVLREEGIVRVLGGNVRSVAEHLRWNHPLWQIEVPLDAVPAGDHDLRGPQEQSERMGRGFCFGTRSVPPSANAARACERARRQRSFALQSCKDRLGHRP